MGAAYRTQHHAQSGRCLMIDDYASFFSFHTQDRRDVFEAAARRLNTLPSYVEKDFWVCLVLDLLFNQLPDRHPKLLFKGGTSLSKAFGLINRFSEDIDLVVFRDGLGFVGDRDPTISQNLSNKKRTVLFGELRSACSNYVCGDLQTDLKDCIAEIVKGCEVTPDDSDVGGQTLYVKYPTVYPNADVEYVEPRIRIEAGARSALDPNTSCSVTPLIAVEIPDRSFCVGGIRTITPERTLWEKLLILHGLHCGYRDEQRLPTDRDRFSRHYYDCTMILQTETGRNALSDFELLTAVREHNLIAFRQAWRRLEEAVPGTLRFVPQPDLLKVIKRDYAAMEGMILGDVPEFDWIVETLVQAEKSVNSS
ncbi:MAG: nucleotidyl transferase AbiEii/AbiGii toxin family protein [Gemmatimonadota bacterium]|nr:nucleotidyl transferase AbiEii/AbiGii toxin family protein [Gemmatimonadota bacterium]